jgi:hypothetical protein
MIAIVIIANSVVDVVSSSSSHATVIATPEFLLERYALLCQPLLLLLELSFKLLELFQLGLWSPQRWWHSCTCSVHGVRQGAFALIFIRGSFAVFPIAHETFSRWVMTLIIRVETLARVVVSARGLVPSPRVIKPEEISVSPGAIVLLGVNT